VENASQLQLHLLSPDSHAVTFCIFFLCNFLS